MVQRLLLTIILLATFSPSYMLADWGYEEENNLIILHSGIHNNILKKFDYILISYEIPRCIHCKRLNKNLSKVAFSFKNYKKRIPFAKFDCKKSSNTCSRLLIPSYPYIKLYYQGHAFDYLGPRTKKHIKKFVKDKVNKGFWRVKDKSVLNKVFAKSEETIIFNGTPSEQEKKILRIMSKSDLGAEYMYSKIPELARAIKHSQAKLIFKKGASEIVEYKPASWLEDKNKETKPIVLEELTNWLFNLRNPGIIQVGKEFTDRVIFNHNHALILFTSSVNNKEVKLFTQAVHNFKKNIVCAVSALDAEDEATNLRLRSEMKVEGQKMFIMYIDPIHDFVFRKWKFSGKINDSNIKIFLESVWEGHQDAYYASEESPLMDDSPLKVRILLFFGCLR